VNSALDQLRRRQDESMIELAPRGLLSAPFPLVSGPIDRDDVYGSPG
jgi:hypothetical protein